MRSALPIPQVQDVEAIAAIADPVRRNLNITQCYQELSVAAMARTGAQANWCTFATWASRQAGETIRGEDLAQALATLTRPPAAREPERDLARAAQALGAVEDESRIVGTAWSVLDPAAAVARAGDAVARGNRKVFEEIAREFARFYAALLADEAPDPGRLADWCAGLREGEPPEGQDLLRRAFTHYYASFFAADPKARLELLLLGNLEIGLHEQTRLQPEIAEALDAAFVDRAEFRRRLLAELYPAQGWLVRFRLAVTRLFGGPTPLDRAADAFLAFARLQAHRVITEQLMTLALPGGVRLRLGLDLPVPYPDLLRQLSTPELVALVARIDPTPDSTTDSGALDWADLPERLHYIADLFRGFATAPELFTPPYSDEQVAVLRGGGLPPRPW